MLWLAYYEDYHTYYCIGLPNMGINYQFQLIKRYDAGYTNEEYTDMVHALGAYNGNASLRQIIIVNDILIGTRTGELLQE